MQTCRTMIMKKKLVKYWYWFSQSTRAAWHPWHTAQPSVSQTAWLVHCILKQLSTTTCAILT